MILDFGSALLYRSEDLDLLDSIKSSALIMTPGMDVELRVTTITSS